MPATCLSSAQVCRIRAARIDNCDFTTGPTATVIADCVVKVSADPEYETGEDLVMKDGCGKICATLKVCDQLKRMNVTIELATRNLPLLEILTGGRLLSADGTNFTGFARRAIGQPCPPKVSLEIWTRAIDAGGNCAVTEQWFRTALPNASLTLGGFSFENAIATTTLTGFVEALPNWNRGPADDWPDPTGLGDKEVEAFILDPLGPPALPDTCDYTAGTNPANIP